MKNTEETVQTTDGPVPETQVQSKPEKRQQRIQGTQASLEDLFEFESGMKPENIIDVAEVVNYVRALNYLISVILQPQRL